MSIYIYILSRLDLIRWPNSSIIKCKHLMMVVAKGYVAHKTGKRLNSLSLGEKNQKILILT